MSFWRFGEPSRRVYPLLLNAPETGASQRPGLPVIVREHLENSEVRDAGDVWHLKLKFCPFQLGRGVGGKNAIKGEMRGSCAFANPISYLFQLLQ